ncbi:hypothetical protein LTR09_012771 [Extremus antarcticus]|uniref:Rhodopsin domain-containing protein n=1 Tax=Extremus antarcticus TaxID=702011 RepID=A0AAJ0D4P5_9PEZI|nr:hypothetical protein LTR09_012771 [Extremus antarcticus]
MGTQDTVMLAKRSTISRSPRAAATFDEIARRLLPAYWPIDSGGNVIVPAYTCIAYTILILAIRYYLGKGSGSNAAFDLTGEAAACAFLITSFVLDHMAVKSGLGSQQETLSSHETNETFKYVYAAQLVGVLAIWAAKVSTATLHWRIERDSGNLRLRIKMSFGIAAIWGVVSLALIAFQCPPPTPWTRLGSSCSAYGPTQYTFIGLNIASDMWLALAPLSTIHGLQMPLARRRRVMFVLALRLVQFWAGLQSGRANVETRDEFELRNTGTNSNGGTGRTQRRGSVPFNSNGAIGRGTSADSDEALVPYPAHARVDGGSLLSTRDGNKVRRSPVDDNGILQTRSFTIETEQYYRVISTKDALFTPPYR